jgi:hypothetical protein
VYKGIKSSSRASIWVGSPARPVCAATIIDNLKLRDGNLPHAGSASEGKRIAAAHPCPSLTRRVVKVVG